jgi:hypothetical protein
LPPPAAPPAVASARGSTVPLFSPSAAPAPPPTPSPRSCAPTASRPPPSRPAPTAAAAVAAGAGAAPPPLPAQSGTGRRREALALGMIPQTPAPARHGSAGSAVAPPSRSRPRRLHPRRRSGGGRQPTWPLATGRHLFRRRSAERTVRRALGPGGVLMAVVVVAVAAAAAAAEATAAAAAAAAGQIHGPHGSN